MYYKSPDGVRKTLTQDIVLFAFKFRQGQDQRQATVAAARDLPSKPLFFGFYSFLITLCLRGHCIQGRPMFEPVDLVFIKGVV